MINLQAGHSNFHLQVSSQNANPIPDQEFPIDLGSADAVIGQGTESRHTLFDQLRRNNHEPIRHPIKKDGSCWCRALWQCIFSQIFNNDPLFDDFIGKILAAQSAREIPDQLADSTIAILKKLKGMGEEERIAFLNHTHIDETLIFFMRHAAVNYIKRSFKGPPQELDRIRNDKSLGGAAEVSAFARYFNLETHRIYKDFNDRWVYEMCSGNGKATTFFIDEMAQSIPHTCLFGVNDRHYEAISFNPFIHVTKQESLPVCTNSLTNLSLQEFLKFDLNAVIIDEMPSQVICHMVEINKDRLSEKINDQNDIHEKVRVLVASEPEMQFADLQSIYTMISNQHGRKIMRDVLGWIKMVYLQCQQDPDDDLYCQRFLLMKACLFLLRSPETSSENVLAIFNTLEAAANTCSEEQYDFLVKCIEKIYDLTPDNLEMTIQLQMRHIKRDVLNSCYENNYHMRNLVYSLVEKTLGLDPHPKDTFAAFARTVGGETHTTEEQVYEGFIQAYTPYEVINLMKQFLNQKMDGSAGNAFILQEIRLMIHKKLIESGIEQSLEAMRNQLESNEEKEKLNDWNLDITMLNPFIGEINRGNGMIPQGYITDRGVALLLVAMGILKEKA